MPVEKVSGLVKTDYFPFEHSWFPLNKTSCTSRPTAYHFLSRPRRGGSRSRRALCRTQRHRGMSSRVWWAPQSKLARHRWGTPSVSSGSEKKVSHIRRKGIQFYDGGKNWFNTRIHIIKKQKTIYSGRNDEGILWKLAKVLTLCYAVDWLSWVFGCRWTHACACHISVYFDKLQPAIASRGTVQTTWQ